MSSKNTKNTIWECEPHTIAKHRLLKKYLDAWFPIIGRNNSKIVFMDGFAGPGTYSNGEIGSPIIALRSAMGHKEVLQHTEVVLAFIEKDEPRLTNLTELMSIEPKVDNFKVHCINDGFMNVINSQFDHLESATTRNAPIFCFLDPFGFSDVPYTVLERLLKLERTEAFIYFPRDHINRFLFAPDVAHHMKALFGLEDITLPEGEQKRLDKVKSLYEGQLKKVAQFVCCFTMINSHNKPIYDLFFTSNHILGFIKMKEAMWAVDKSGGFTFSDRENSTQLHLFEHDPIPGLIKLLRITGGQRRNISYNTIEDAILEKTIYLSGHVKSALKRMEEDGQLQCHEFKSDGNKRIKNSFPRGTIIDFLG